MTGVQTCALPIFGYFSCAGGIMMLIYAVWRMDPVFILGQSTGLVVYVRNLFLIHREKRLDMMAAKDVGGDD